MPERSRAHPPSSDELARLGFLMAQWRAATGVTQREAAAAAGISAATWGALERVPRHAPDATTLRAIAATINISPVDALRAGGFDPELADVIDGLVADFDIAIEGAGELAGFLRARRADLDRLLNGERRRPPAG